MKAPLQCFPVAEGYPKTAFSGGSRKAGKMPKKMGINSKAEEARGRKAALETEKKEKSEKEKVEKFWTEAEGPKPKSLKKKEEDAERKAEAAAKRAEAKKIAEEEQAELEKSLKRVDKKSVRVGVPVPKVTAAQLAKAKEEEAHQLEATKQAAKNRDSRTADEIEYERLVTFENTNRDETSVDARSVDTALAQMVIANDTTPDRHPERRVKASYKAFEDAELARLKEEKPGLTRTQYKDMVWKNWKKSPDNPLNQPTSANVA